MPALVRGILGEHVPLRVTLRERRLDSEDGRLYAANGLRVKSIKDPTGTALASGVLPSFAYVQDGEYVANWDTSSLSTLGDYEVEVEISVGWDSVANTRITTRKDFVVRLVKQGAS